MTLPEYSVVLVAGRITGEVKITLVVASGKATDFKTDGPVLLASAVRSALDAAIFTTQCAGKTVKMVFRFGLESSAADTSTPRQKWTFTYPNTFSIVSEARLPQP